MSNVNLKKGLEMKIGKMTHGKSSTSNFPNFILSFFLNAWFLNSLHRCEADFWPSDFCSRLLEPRNWTSDYRMKEMRLTFATHFYLLTRLPKFHWNDGKKFPWTFFFFDLIFDFLFASGKKTKSTDLLGKKKKAKNWKLKTAYSKIVFE